jgi:hypothetical protein
MAENTRMKELSADVKRNAETIEGFRTQIDRLEVANAARFEEMQKNNDSQFSQIHNALDIPC